MSTMKAVLATSLLAFVSVVVSDMAGECNMAGFYLELGCSPLPRSDNSSGCPEAFQCPDLHPDPKKCYYRGVAYGDRRALPQAQVKNPCSQACSCRVDGDPQFDCAAIDCVETFDSDVQQQCISTYELDSCCSVGNVCGKDAIMELKTCEVDGVTFKEGESFEPRNTRKTCICTADFNGTYDNPSYCRDINCGIEIHYQEKIFNKCAPVFPTNVKTSCPISFECPTKESRVRRGTNVQGIAAECTFGDLRLMVGDEVTQTESCASCSCEVPPFVSCTRRSCDSTSFGADVGMGLGNY